MEMSETTILDYLNEDCWRVVLEYVPVQDIIRSERVSRRWQRAMLEYLYNIHFSIVHPALDESSDCSRNAKLPLIEDEWSSFIRWTRKLGASVMNIYCNSEETLEILAESCPNLRALTFYKFQEQYVEYDELVTLSENFKYLQRLTFNISFVSDYFVTKFIANRALEELQFSGNHKVTGFFLNKIKLKNLKALNFKNCKRLNFDLNVIPGLKKLELNYVPWSICEPIIQVLNKLQELEHLELILSFNTANDVLFECVSKLSRLKHLNVNIKASNDDLVLLSMGCMELRSLLLANCTDISGRGVTALCSNAGERLTTLGLKCSDRLTDDNVVTIIKCCPNLTFLDVSDCSRLTYALLSRVESARIALRRIQVLRLRAMRSTFTFDQTRKYEELYPGLSLEAHCLDEDIEDEFEYWPFERSETPTYMNIPNYFALVAQNN